MCARRIASTLNVNRFARAPFSPLKFAPPRIVVTTARIQIDARCAKRNFREEAKDDPNCDGGPGQDGLSHLAIVRAHPAIDLVAGCDATAYLTDILGKHAGLK